MQNLKRSLVVFLIAAVAAFPAASAELATQKSTGNSVTVDVTPQNLSSNANTWDFKVVFDTHSADLSDDVMKSVVLLDGAGNQHNPLAWDGAGPGGHHREGVLRFEPVSPRPQAIELRITRPGETAPRSFRWQLN